VGSKPDLPFPAKRQIGNPMKRLYRLFILFFISSIFVISVGSTYSNENEGISTSTEPSAKALVVVYSYTGNTKAVADEIIKRFSADSVIIKAKEYDGLTGGISAHSDAWNELMITEIKPETVDLNQYNLIFLGSPIWWYRPAVPLWTFVEKNNFKNKTVVLFNTFKSKFKSKYIEEFKQMVQKKGGKFHDHIYVRRGRWYSQLSREELLEKFNKILDAKEEQYKGLISQEK
jgi:flavodoxin